jgi:hypothetical protein
VFINKSQGQFTEACLLLAAGKRQEGLDLLGAYIEGFKTKATKKRRGLNAKQKQKLQIAECLKEAVTVKDPDCVTFPVNFKIDHNHTSKVLQVAYSRDGSTLASLSAAEVSLWRIKPASAEHIATVQLDQPLSESSYPQIACTKDTVAMCTANLELQVFSFSQGQGSKKDSRSLARDVEQADSSF